MAWKGKEPVRIDLLVIKNWEEASILKNEIGHIMRKYNVLEYKGPGDDMSIDTFYKTLGYACLYKGYGKKVNEIPAEELTVSLFREAYPKKLFRELQNRGYQIEERYAVLQASVSANYEAYQEVRRDADMCEALRQLQIREDMQI